MRSDLRLPGAIADAASRLAELDRELRSLSRGVEPRQAATQIITLLNERDRLRGVWTRTCVWCGDSFNASRAHAQYCSAQCRKRSSRDVTDRVTDSGEIQPVCGDTRVEGTTGRIGHGIGLREG